MADRTPDEARAALARSVEQVFSGFEGAPAIPPAPTPAPAVPAPQRADVPAAAPAGTTPAGTTPQIDPNDPWAPMRKENGLIWGKYRTGEDVEKAYFHAQNTISSLADQNAALRTQGASPQGTTPGAEGHPTFVPGSAPGSAPRVNPIARTLPLDQLVKDEAIVKASEESGVSPELLVRAIAAVTQPVAAETVNARLQPMEQLQDAETYMRTKYPDSANHVQEVGNFIKTNPDVQGTVAALVQAGNARAAMEYAYTMYTVSTGLQVQQGMKANSEVAEQERVAARTAAGLPTSPNNGVHQTDAKPRITPDEIEFLKERSAAGDQRAAAELRRALIGHMLPKEWFQG